MTQVRYIGLGGPHQAAKAFDALKAYVSEILELQAECEPLGADDQALAIALDGLQTAAFHFTRRRFYYFELERPAYRAGNQRLRERAERIRAFETLTPYYDAIRTLQSKCAALPSRLAGAGHRETSA